MYAGMPQMELLGGNTPAVAHSAVSVVLLSLTGHSRVGC